MVALCLAVEITARNTTAVEELISAISSYYSEAEAARKIFTPVLALFTVEDRIWFDEMRRNAKWNY
jgi:hypothetical protein